jgi:TetR/AcrR family transcriptional regulator, repressor for uid operon
MDQVEGQPPGGDARETQRRRIMEAALACFARSGFHGSSMQEICAEAGMSAGNLYRYFPSKEAIIAAISSSERERCTAMFEVLERADDPIAALVSLGHRFMDEMAESPEAALNAEIMAEAMRNPEMRERYRRDNADMRAAVARALERGIPKGLVDPALDPAIAARMIIALGDGLMLHRTLDPSLDPCSLKSMLERMILAFLRPGAGSPGTSPPDPKSE